MGRLGLIEKFYEEIKIKNIQEDYWLVAYDFPKSKGSPHFYTLFKKFLHTLRAEGTKAQRIQSSIFYTNDLHTAIVATKLATHYNADVRLFKVEEKDITRLIQPYFDFTITEEELPSVMKAVHYKLKKLSSDFQSNNEVDQLCTFIWVQVYHVRPITPIDITIFSRILRMLEGFESFETLPIKYESSPGLTIDNYDMVIKSVVEYLIEHRGIREPTVEVLKGLIRRVVDGDYHIPKGIDKLFTEIFMK